MFLTHTHTHSEQAEEDASITTVCVVHCESPVTGRGSDGRLQLGLVLRTPTRSFSPRTSLFILQGVLCAKIPDGLIFTLGERESCTLFSVYYEIRWDGEALCNILLF